MRKSALEYHWGVKIKNCNPELTTSFFQPIIPHRNNPTTIITTHFGSLYSLAYTWSVLDSSTNMQLIKLSGPYGSTLGRNRSSTNMPHSFCDSLQVCLLTMISSGMFDADHLFKKPHRPSFVALHIYYFSQPREYRQSPIRRSTDHRI